MKKMSGKRLNNKGFTLIELLAVVVILAVVMGIAMTSVLSAMNKARGGSLEDSAITIAQAFNQKYTEALVDGVPSAVYSDIANPGNFAGYNFATDAAYSFTVALRNTFNLSLEAYVFAEGDVNNAPVTTGAASETAATTSVGESFVAFDSNEAKFLVCLVAKNTGSYYVDNYTVGNTNNTGNPNGVVFDSVTYTFASGVMFACSNGVTSWQKTADTSLYTTAPAS